MLVDELLIPDRQGTIAVPLDEKVTVFAGLAAPARARMAMYLVEAVAGTGPVRARTRSVPEPQPEGDGPPAPTLTVEALRRAMVVTAADLGLDGPPPDPSVTAERTATALALRQLEAERGAIEAAAAEAERLQLELDAPTRLLVPASSATAGGPEDDAGSAGPTLLAAAPVIDRLLARRQEAEDRLVPLPGPLDRLDWEARLQAEADLRRCDKELAGLAAEASVVVGPDGPGPALARAVAARVRVRTRAGGGPPVDDDAHRLVARRRAMLRARLAELPTADDVRAAERRLRAARGHLERLGGPGPAVGAVRNTLLARVAALRPHGVTAFAPLVLDDPWGALDPSTRCDLLDLVARVAERTQVVVLTGDPTVRAWARHRAGRGELHLVDLDRAAPGS